MNDIIQCVRTDFNYVVVYSKTNEKHYLSLDEYKEFMECDMETITVEKASPRSIQLLELKDIKEICYCDKDDGWGYVTIN